MRDRKFYILWCGSYLRSKLISLGKDITLLLLHLLFVLENGEGWKVKKIKYYLPLFNYINDYSLCEAYKVMWGLIRNEKTKKIRHIPRIVYYITSKCTLKCEGCSTLTPCFKNKEDVRVNDICADLKMLEKQVERIEVIALTGGEPFLHKEMHILLKYLNETKIYKRIEITSNGMGMLSDSILNELKSDKVTVTLSYYGTINRSKMIRTVGIFNREGIKYRIVREDMTTWWDFGEPQLVIDGRSKERFINCFAPEICRTIYKGHLGICGRLPYMVEKNIMADGIVSLSSESLHKDLYNFYSFSQEGLCNYCKYNSIQIKRANQMRINCEDTTG